MTDLPLALGKWNAWWSGRRVVFVSGTAGDTRRYRCDYQAEQLRLLGATAEVVAYEQEPELAVDELVASDCVVLHRLEWDERVERLVALARERAVPTVFDTDDLTFEADAAAELAWFVGLDEAGRRASFERQQTTLAACSAATVSTSFLAQRARLQKRRVAVTPNAIGAEMVREADAARKARYEAAPSPVTTIAYLSGTPTHDRDILEAADALVRTLRERRDVRLLVVGYLELDARFDALASQIDRLPFQPRARLPEILAGVDVNLAPLEHGNSFSWAKSCLKYVEAGIVRTPTIASGAPDFVRVIGHGYNGLLARSREDWAHALDRLLGDPGDRRAVASRAYEDVRARHTTAARAPALGRTFALAAIASSAEARLYNRARRRAEAAASSRRD